MTAATSLSPSFSLSSHSELRVRYVNINSVKHTINTHQIRAFRGSFMASSPVNAKQKCHLRCETEMSCFGSENAFDRLAIYFRAFSFPNRNHENDNFLVYNLVYKAIA